MGERAPVGEGEGEAGWSEEVWWRRWACGPAFVNLVFFGDGRLSVAFKGRGRGFPVLTLIYMPLSGTGSLSTHTYILCTSYRESRLGPS